MVLSNSPEVVGLRRRMTANGAKSRFVNEVSDKCAFDGIRGDHSDVDDEADTISDSVSQYLSSGRTSTASSKSDMTEADADLGEARVQEEAAASSETLKPRPRTSPPKIRQKPGYQALGRRPVREAEDIPESSSGSWFTFDKSIVVALVSPIGQWLTGGDHVKNLLLVLLLIFYLHQLIEAPWTLYRMSRSSHELPEPESEDQTPAEARLESVHAELRSLELLYLVLTVLSPFLGATLLRVVSTTLTGNESTLSWFSTALFVLATGIRPWSHLVERLQGRSAALKDALREGGRYYNREEVDEEREIEIAGLHEVVGELRENVQKLESRVGNITSQTQIDAKETYKRMHALMDGVEKAIKRQQKQVGKMMNTHETRLAALEGKLGGLQLVAEANPDIPGQVNVVARSLSSSQRWFCWLLRLPSVKIERAVGSGHTRRALSLRTNSSERVSSPTIRLKNPSDPVNGHRHGPPLDPIPEEGAPALQDVSGTKERRRQTHTSPISTSPILQTQIISPDVQPSPVQRLISFLLSPIRFGIQLTWMTLMMPKQLLRLVNA